MIKIIIEPKKEKEIKEKKPFRERVREIADFARYNPDVTAVAVSAGLYGVKLATKAIAGGANLYMKSKELKVTSRRCYDASEGHYWSLKRDLSNADWLEISRRMDSGERLGRVLADMKVLKR